MIDDISGRDVFQAIFYVGSAVMAYIMRNFKSDLRQVETDCGEVGKDLSNHKLSCSEKYASKSDVKESFDAVNAAVRDVALDVKKLLSRGM